MDDFVQLVFFAILAGFVLYKLRTALGHQSYDEAAATKEHSKQHYRDMLNELAKKTSHQAKEIQDNQVIESDLPEHVTSVLVDIRKNDLSFSAAAFLAGAGKAFEVILDALTRQDKEALKPLLSREIYSLFVEQLEREEKEHQRTERTLIAIISSQLTDAELNGSKAKLTITFLSEQITIVKDDQGEIIEGDPSDVERIEDTWTFMRDIKSSNPNWKLIKILT